MTLDHHFPHHSPPPITFNRILKVSSILQWRQNTKAQSTERNSAKGLKEGGSWVHISGAPTNPELKSKIEKKMDKMHIF